MGRLKPGGKSGTTRKEILIAIGHKYGLPPYECLFCGEEIPSYIFDAHHLDGDDNNHDPENLAPAHGGCHRRYHRLLEAWPPEVRRKKSSLVIDRLRVREGVV